MVLKCFLFYFLDFCENYCFLLLFVIFRLLDIIIFENKFLMIFVEFENFWIGILLMLLRLYYTVFK